MDIRTILYEHVAKDVNRLWPEVKREDRNYEYGDGPTNLAILGT